MASLREFIPAVRSIGPLKFVITICKEISKDQLASQAAAVAYAWLFAIFPFLLFLLTLFAYIPQRHMVKPYEEISSTINKVMAKDAAQTVLGNLREVMHEPRSGLLSIGLIVTLWIASGGMSMTMSALDTAYDSTKINPFYKQRPVAILLTIIVMVLIAIVLILLPIGTAIEDWLASTQLIPGRVLWLLTFARYLLAILLMLSILALLYTFGTRVRHRFSFLTPGAIFTVLVWVILGESFRFYVDRFGRYQKTYGAVGGVTILLLFFYLDALVLLIGAEINNLVNHAVASKGNPSAASTGTSTSETRSPDQ
jgi:membrane protein